MRSSRAAGQMWLLAGIVGSLGGAAHAQPTYYTDGSVSHDGVQNYTASYNYAPNFYTDASQGQPQAYQSGPSRTSKSSAAKAPKVAQPNYYTNVSYSPVNTRSAADMYASQQQAASAGTQQQWDSSYASQQQLQQQAAPKKRGLVSRVFSRSNNSQETASVPASSGNIFQRGVASWYGRDWHGKKTANGERYNMDSMTAAHKTLPFGTLVKVKNETNGRECVVRINNRGPFTKGRVIDLSRAAANQLGMAGRGICKVSMEVLGRK